MIRLLDLILSFIGLIIGAPLFLILSLMIILDSKGGVFYKQQRIGKEGRPFLLFKFRSMRTDSDKLGLLTVGNRDARITRVGLFLRKTKLDELPQLINVIKGDMSLVGPRPEVEKYTRLYTPEQKKTLTVRPGITDLASILFRNENELLAAQEDPETYYIEHVMPEKLRLNMDYINNPGVGKYMRIIFKTIHTVFTK